MKRLLLIVLTLLLGTGSALASEQLKVLSDRDFAPYSMIQNGKPSGIDVEVFAEACKRAGVDYSLQLVEWEDLVKRLHTGQCHAAFSLFRTPEREKDVLFVDRAVMHYSDYGLFTRVGSGLAFDSWDDLRGKRIGSIGGFAMSDGFQQAAKNGIFTSRAYVDEASCVGGLLKGEIDGFVGQLDTTHYQLNRMGMTNTVVYLPKLVRSRRPAYIGFSRAALSERLEGVAARLGKALQSMYRDGTYNSIARRYLFRF